MTVKIWWKYRVAVSRKLSEAVAERRGCGEPLSTPEYRKRLKELRLIADRARGNGYRWVI